MTGFALKIIAVLSMAIDHIGYVLLPNAMWMRMVGRLAFPIFAFSAAEGARFTHDRKKYLTRLLLWGLISEIPYDLMCSKAVFALEGQNVCFTLAAGVACIYLLEKRSAKNMTAMLVILSAAYFLNIDYSFIGVLAVVVIHRYASRGKTVNGVALACLLLMLFSSGIQILAFLVLIPIWFYNGRAGAHLKYLFYVFYPLHMLIIWAVWAVTNTSII